MFPIPLVVSFIAIVGVLYTALILGVLYADNRVERDSTWTIRLLRLSAGGFLLLTGLFALDKSFADFTGTPPKLIFPIVAGFAGMFAMAFHPRMKEWLEQIPQSWLIGLQSFRIFVEIILFYMAARHLMPVEMTWEGRNFDLLTGVTAPIFAFYVYSKEQGRSTKASVAGATKTLIIVWNILGMLLVGNAFVTGMLTTPTPMRMIWSEVANTAVGFFPFIWLPAFLVPFAFFLHILSLRKALAKTSRDSVVARAGLT
jgi:hypothetical protein